MYSKLFAAAVIAGAVLLLPARADASCCDHAKMPCCEKAEKACCDHKGHGQPEASAVDMLLSMDPQWTAAQPPARITADVWFTRPTFIGKSIVQGHYVIEHDNDRMARGEPCTHVYAFDDRETPVATFHCTHLERERADRGRVVVETLPDGMRKLIEFQFAGEVGGHGYPLAR